VKGERIPDIGAVFHRSSQKGIPLLVFGEAMVILGITEVARSVCAPLRKGIGSADGLQKIGPRQYFAPQSLRHCFSREMFTRSHCKYSALPQFAAYKQISAVIGNLLDT